MKLQVIVGIAMLNLMYTCPAISSADGSGDCSGTYIFAAVCITQLGVNLALFHWYNRRNKVIDSLILCIFIPT